MASQKGNKEEYENNFVQNLDEQAIGDTKIIEKKNESRKSHDQDETKNYPVTPSSSSQDNTRSIKSEKDTTLKKNLAHTPSTAATAKLTDDSFDSTASYWTQSQQQQTWQYTNYMGYPWASPVHIVPPYSAAMLSSLSPPNMLPYQMLPIHSPGQIPFQMPGYTFSPQISSNTPISSHSHLSHQQTFSSPTQSSPHVNTFTAKDDSSHQTIPNSSKKRNMSSSQQQHTQPKKKGKRKERKVMPPIYNDNVIFASPHKELDLKRLPKRLNLTPHDTNASKGDEALEQEWEKDKDEDSEVNYSDKR